MTTSAHHTYDSARYTYEYGDTMSGLLDRINEFCLKYPEYRLLQVVVIREQSLYAVLTTDPV